MLDGQTLPLIFAALMGVAILLYVVLDGYDLGVGMLMSRVNRPDRDKMVATIGPFWDANETWLVLGIGLLLVAFPVAHGIVLTSLYLPVALMLLGLTLRGVAFEFRVKAQEDYQRWWDYAFIGGSALASLTQGYMLGLYVMGFSGGWEAHAFAALAAVGLAAAYLFVGATWLIAKTEGELQKRAVGWGARHAHPHRLRHGGDLGRDPARLAAHLRALVLLSQHHRARADPADDGGAVPRALVFLKRMPRADHSLDLVPFLGATSLFALGFLGLAYSFYPYVVPERLTIWQAASAPESLLIILVGALFVLPMIAAYTAFSYWVFRGKAAELRYD